MKKNNFLVGLEREALRITENGAIDLSPHPESFGDKLFNPYITADFSESQLELITKTFPSNEEALSSLKEILSFIYFKEPEIYLHNHSMPPKGIAFPARFGKGGKEKENYRAYLLKKYGLSMQLISGIHYNFSINDLDDEGYFHIIRNTIRYGYIFPSLFGNSTSTDFPYATSIRCSGEGYFPKFQHSISVDFDSGKKYLDSLKQREDLYSENEYYLFIKPKFKEGKVTYIEHRGLDINPDMEAGITIETMNFMSNFFYKMLEIPSPPLHKKELFSCLQYYDTICLEGKKKSHQRDVENTLKKLHLSIPEYNIPKKIEIKEHPYLEKAAERSVYKTLECSTQLLIEDALSLGIKVTIIDRETNTIKLSKEGKESILMQATFSEKDSFISYKIQKDKHLTKKLLKEASLQVPKDSFFTDKDFDYTKFLGKKICIKPAMANYGDGISILNTTNKSLLTKAIDEAFTYSASILIEDFFEGDEYRFFVIDGKEIFICKRSPPSIIGDGEKNIEELIAEENKKRPKEFPIKYEGSSVPILKMGEKRLLRENSNVSTGGMSTDVTNLVDESYKNIAKEAATVMKSFLCGVDIIIKNPNKAATKDNYAILETNFNPALYLHRHPLFGGQKVTHSIFKALGLISK